VLVDLPDTTDKQISWTLNVNVLNGDKTEAIDQKQISTGSVEIKDKTAKIDIGPRKEDTIKQVNTLKADKKNVTVVLGVSGKFPSGDSDIYVVDEKLEMSTQMVISDIVDVKLE